MWCAWPHLRRFWAGVGTVTAGLLVTWLYSLLSEQALPHLRIASTLLHNYWPWLGAGLLALTTASIVAERAHRQHATRAPQPLRVARRSWPERFKRPPPPIVPAATNASTMVGRTSELAKLDDWFTQVKTGARRVIFVSGEPGIGKTTLTRAFLESITNDRAGRIGRGQCVEQYGAGEPYMPILEALTRLCREPGGEKLVEILHRMAPAWLAQMPSLISAEDRARLQGLAQGTTQQRMLREMAEALEVIAAERPLVLMLEDLHWSDPSTLDLIATVARRNEPARLMMLGTYRPVEMLAGEHPLRAMKEELELHQQAIELRLPLLSERDVAAYLTDRFGDDREKIAAAIYARSEGNPLFMVNVVDYLVEQGSLANADKIEAPRNIRQMIERNLQHLSFDEQRVLEAASVAGAEFSAAAVAAALEKPIDEIETCCTRLARNEQFIRSQAGSKWPDGTVSDGYRFLHALYQAVLYERTPSGQRSDHHRRIAQREETAWGAAATEIAAELADHYCRANDNDKAVEYLGRAGHKAIERSANLEAISHLKKALELLESRPDTPERTQAELQLLTMLGIPVVATQGYGAQEVARIYTRARELCTELDNTHIAFLVLRGLWAFHLTRANYQVAYESANEFLILAQRGDDSGLMVEAHFLVGFTLQFLGEFGSARTHCDKGTALYDSKVHRALAFSFGVDPGVNCLSCAPLAIWSLGYPDESLERSSEALRLAEKLNHPFSLGWALIAATWFRQYRLEESAVEKQAESASALAAEQGFPLWSAWATILRGWVMSARGRTTEGIKQICEGLDFMRAVNAELARTHFLGLLAESYSKSGKREEAVTTLAEALGVVNKTGERFYEAELYRLKGELLLMGHNLDMGGAENSFCTAIEIARKQSAKSWELRATTSLARLLRDTGRRDEARTMLAEIYNWFTEGFDTKDLKEAKSVLDELGVAPG
jgi:predicted ATPase